MNNNRLTVFMLIGFLAFTACAGNYKTTSNKAITKKKKTRLLVPAGVDSSVAAAADSLADNLFVSIDRETRAETHKRLGKRSTVQSDTLWKYLASELDPSFKVSQNDSIRAIEAFNAGAKNLQELAQLEQSSEKNSSPEFFKMRVQSLLEDARKSFERALVLNPFDLETKSWLARVYQSLAMRFLDDNNHKMAIKILENLTRLEQGEHGLFARLAEGYYALEDWDAANYHFAQAEAVLRNTAGLDFSSASDVEHATLDTSALFYYIYYQGDTEIKMHNAQRGVQSLQRALAYASSEKERADIQSYLDWINWDDGNVEAVERRDQYLALQEQGKYREAAAGFLKLIPQLRTRRAIDETVWRLAVLEFQYLDRKNEGIDRLKHVVHLASKNQDGAPIDTTYKKYFNSYGIMCHNLGLENFNKNRKFAFTYFQQAAAIDWESRAKSYLEMAKLSRNNPKVVMENCRSALAAIEQLDHNERLQAYQLMVEALKRTGQFDQARSYYAQWVDLQKRNLRSSTR
jgi:Flp pilus assembly protein TadD